MSAGELSIITSAVPGATGVRRPTRWHLASHSPKRSVFRQLFYRVEQKIEKVFVSKSLKSLIECHLLGTVCFHNFTPFLLCIPQTVAFK